jgi:hypothetical protein
MEAMIFFLGPGQLRYMDSDPVGLYPFAVPNTRPGLQSWTAPREELELNEIPDPERGPFVCF